MRWVAEHGLFSLPAADHARVRKLVSASLTPRAVARMETQVREVIDRFAKPLMGLRGVVDLHSGFTDPIPNTVISRITGIPPAGPDRAARRLAAAGQPGAPDRRCGLAGAPGEPAQPRSARAPPRPGSAGGGRAAAAAAAAAATDENFTRRQGYGMNPSRKEQKKTTRNRKHEKKTKCTGNSTRVLCFF